MEIPSSYYIKHNSLSNNIKLSENPQLPPTEKKQTSPMPNIEKRIRTKYCNGSLTPIVERNVKEETTTNDSKYLSQSNSMLGKDDEWSKHSHLSSIIKENNVTLQHAKEIYMTLFLKVAPKKMLIIMITTSNKRPNSYLVIHFITGKALKMCLKMWNSN